MLRRRFDRYPFLLLTTLVLCGWLRETLRFATLLSALLWVVTAQAAELAWVRGLGGADEDYGWAIGIAPNDDVLVAGHFTGPAKFGPATPNAIGSLDIFVAKYNPTGDLVWVQSLGGTGDDDARAVAADARGNIYVTGSLTAAPSSAWLARSGTNQRSSAQAAAGTHAFLAKLDAQGNPVWLRQSGSDPGSHQGRGVAIDRNGSIYWTGYFNSVARFDNATVTSAGFSDIFLAKLDANGNALWARRAGGTNADETFGLALDLQGNCIVSGSIRAVATFEETTVPSTGQGDAFVSKYNAEGGLLWIATSQGASAHNVDVAFGVAADSANAIYATGLFNSRTEFGLHILDHLGSGDIFVVKYSPTGEVQWAQRFGGPGPDQGHSIAVAGDDSVYVTGFFFDRINFGPYQLHSPNHTDVFLVKFDGRGSIQWAWQPGGSAYKSGNGLGVNREGTSFITGFFRGTTGFGNFTLTNNFTNNRDAFIARIDTPLAPPRLTFQRAGSELELSWSENGFQLETVSQIDPGTLWASIATSNRYHRVTNAPATVEGQRFFRLRKP